MRERGEEGDRQTDRQKETDRQKKTDRQKETGRQMKSMSVIASFPCPGLAAHQVLAVGSLLGVYVTLDIVNFVSPVAPTRFAKPPRGTLELVKKHHTIIIIVCTHFP